jgi:hypothetical protein
MSEIVSTVPTTKYLYLLGVKSSKKQLLLQFDPDTLVFTEHQVYNYSSMACVGTEKFLVCGGINADLTSITSKCFILEPLKGKIE